MRRLWRLLTHPVFLRLLVAVIAGVIVYVAGPWLRLTREQRFVIPALFGGTVFLFLMIAWFWVWARERGLWKGIRAGADKEVAEAGPDSKKEIEILTREFESACEELNRRRPSTGWFGRDGLYALPWVVVLGPPAAGKTSALQLSGLRFTPLGQGLSGLAGTRNCTWWLSEEAIFLDTAGRYAVEHTDHHEWLGFLRLLRLHRPRRPIDGAIVQLGIDALLDLEPGLLEETALNIQQRIDELIEQLEVRFPVHLVFNKCDRLDGFADYFSQLTREERAQSWGFTLDVDELRGEPVGEAFNRSFEGLIERLTEHTALRLSSLPSIEAREAALSFPRELAQRRERLRAIVEILFGPARLREQPWLKAVYFTSAVQGQPPVPGYRAGLLERWRLPAPFSSGEAPSREAFFVSGMFQRVVQQARRPVRLSARARRRRWARLGAALAGGVLMSFVGSCQVGEVYTERKAWLEAVRDTVRRLETANAAPVDTPERIGRVLELQEELDALLALQDVDGVQESADAALAESIDLYWILPLREALTSHLERAGHYHRDMPLGNEVFIDGFQALKVNRIIRNLPKQVPCAGMLGTEEAAQFMGRYLSDLWARPGIRFEQGLPAPVRERLRTRITAFFEGDQASRLRLDEPLVEGARKALSSNPAPGAYLTLLAYELDLQQRRPLVEQAPAVDAGIQELYLAQGCNTLKDSRSQVKAWMRCLLEEVPEEIAWKEVYLERFELAWIDWLGQLAAASRWTFTPEEGDPLSLEPATRLLGQLSAEPDPLLRRVMRALGDGPACAADAGRKLPGRVQRTMDRVGTLVDYVTDEDLCEAARSRFCPMVATIEGREGAPAASAWSDYLGALRELKTTLGKIQGNTDREEKALELVLKTMDSQGELWNVSRTREELFRRLSDGALWPSLTSGGAGALAGQLEVLSAGLQKLEAGTWSVLVTLAAEAVQKRWTRGVLDPWARTRMKKDDNVAEACARIDKFIKGDLEMFIAAELDVFYVDKRQRSCALRTLNGVVMPLGRDACERITALRDKPLVCEEAGAAAPLEVITFQVDYFPNVTSIQLDTGAKVLVYDVIRNGLGEAQSSLSGRVGVEFYRRAGTGPNKLLGRVELASTLEELVTGVGRRQRTGRIVKNALTVPLPAHLLPPGVSATQKNITLIFNADLTKGQQKAPTSRGELAAIDLPSSLVRHELRGDKPR